MLRSVPHSVDSCARVYGLNHNRAYATVHRQIARTHARIGTVELQRQSSGAEMSAIACRPTRRLGGIIDAFLLKVVISEVRCSFALFRCRAQTVLESSSRNHSNHRNANYNRLDHPQRPRQLQPPLQVLGYPVELVSDGLSSSVTSDRIETKPGRELNGTASVWSALADGYVHIYPEVRETHTSDLRLVSAISCRRYFGYADFYRGRSRQHD